MLVLIPLVQNATAIHAFRHRVVCLMWRRMNVPVVLTQYSLMLLFLFCSFKLALLRLSAPALELQYMLLLTCIVGGSLCEAIRIMHGYNTERQQPVVDILKMIQLQHIWNACNQVWQSFWTCGVHVCYLLLSLVCYFWRQAQSSASREPHWPLCPWTSENSTMHQK